MFDDPPDDWPTDLPGHAGHPAAAVGFALWAAGKLTWLAWLAGVW